VIRTVALLLGGTAGLWLLAAYPAYLLGGSEGMVHSAVAAGICLLPMAGTLAWAARALRGGKPEQALAAVMGGTGLRIVVVIGAAVALYLTAPYFHSRGFLIWVVVFYLVTLTLEMCLLLSRHGEAGRSAGG
jgi:hypothetical protein